MNEKQIPQIHLRRRLNRRSVLQRTALGGAGFAAATALACSTSHKQGATSGQQAGGAAKQPKRGGTLTFAGGMAGSYDVQGRSFDPMIQTQFSAKGYTLFYERLVAYDLRTYAVQPELAQKWEQPSQTEYLFHLQPNVKWQNKPPVSGRPLTSDDIVWSLERARTDDPKFYSRSLLTTVDKIEAPDKATVRITTKGPDAGALRKLSVENLAILAREVFDKYPKPTTADGAVGTGAFMMKSVEQNVGAEYVPNPDYWKPGLPYLQGFRTKQFSDLLTAWSAFLAGQVDVTLTPGSEVKKYVASKGSGFTPEWYSDDTIRLQYPNVKHKPMDDARVTTALKLLTDHDEFVSAWADVQYGRGGFGSILPSALSDYDLTQDEYRSHLEWKKPKDDAVKEALAMLSAAGFNKDNPLKFDLYSESGNVTAAGSQLLQAQWKRLSQGMVDANLKLTQAGQNDQIRASRSFDYAWFGHSTGMVEPDTWLSSTYRTGGSLNFMDFSDPALDAMIDKQRAIFDETQRKAAVKAIVLYMIDHGPCTIPTERYFLDGVLPRVQGHVPEYYLNGRLYQSIWLSE